MASTFELDAPTAVAVVDVEALDGLRPEGLRYEEVSRHPRVRRDLALLVDASTPAGEVSRPSARRPGPRCSRPKLFDRYAGKGVPEGKVSLAVRLTFQRVDRTLKDAEVAEATDRVVQVLADRFGAELR